MAFIKYTLAFALISFFSFEAEALCLTKKCREKKQIGEQIAAEGGDCSSLSGKAKRACRKSVRKAARAEAKEQCGGGLFKGGKCRREIRRDMKAQQGAFGGIGAKQANAEGRANFEEFKQQRKELKQMRKNGEISHEEYLASVQEAKAQRVQSNFKTGRKKAIKTAAVVGAYAGAGVLGAAVVGSTIKVGEKAARKKRNQARSAASLQ
jgi:hypothetical protein